MNFGIYCVFLKDVVCGDLKYGRDYYDYQEGTLVLFLPDRWWMLKIKQIIINLLALDWPFIPI